MLAAGALLGCALELSAAELVNAINGVVHDSVITRQDVSVMSAPAIRELQRQPPATEDALGKALAQTRKESLDQLLDRQLILHEFNTAGYSLPESVIDNIVDERMRAKYRDRRTLIQELRSEGLTFEKYRERVRENFIIEQMRLKNVSSEIIISPHKIETYYQAHLEQYRVPDQVKLRMIVLNKSSDPNAPAAKALAEEILAKLKEGVSFAEMATVNSQGSARGQGGDWGWVERPVLRSELADVAFKLKPGQYSGVIETPEACYLMLVEEAKVAHYKPLNDMRPEIEKNLILEERGRLEKQWIERLRKKTFVRYF